MFIQLMRGSARALERGGVRGLNDLAFKLRGDTPDALKKLIDRPTAFTTKRNAVLVRKALNTDEGAMLVINRIQSSYLGTLEDGGDKTNGIRGAYAQKRRTINRNGNVTARWHRRQIAALLQEKIGVNRKMRGGIKRDSSGKFLKQSVDYQVGRFFVGRLKNGRDASQVGLWERGRNNDSVRLIADFYKRQTYRPGQLGLQAEWNQQFQEQSYSVLSNAIAFEIRKENEKRK